MRPLAASSGGGGRGGQVETVHTTLTHYRLLFDVGFRVKGLDL